MVSLPGISEEGRDDPCSRQTRYCRVTLAALSVADLQAVRVCLGASSIWWYNVALLHSMLDLCAGRKYH